MTYANVARREALSRMLQLKQVERRGWKRHPIPREAVESVADHSFGVALLAWLLCPDELDRSRVLEMALLHDLAEALTGDVTPSDGVPAAKKRADETEALERLLRDFSHRDRGVALLEEYQQQLTPEARWLKAIDKLDMGLQSLAYERAYGLDLAEFRASGKYELERSGLLGWMGEP